jgi:hypothetical protein
MGRRAGIALCALALGFLGCRGRPSRNERAKCVAAARDDLREGDRGTAGGSLSAEEKVLRWIRSCEARMIVFAHGHRTYVRFRGGASVWLRLDESAAGRIWHAADAQAARGASASESSRRTVVFRRLDEQQTRGDTGRMSLRTRLVLAALGAVAAVGDGFFDGHAF